MELGSSHSVEDVHWPSVGCQRESRSAQDEGREVSSRRADKVG